MSIVDEDEETLPSNEVESSLIAVPCVFPSQISTSSSENMLFTDSAGEADISPKPQLGTSRTVNFWSGVCLVVGNQIGAGIFSSPALVNGNVGSVGMSLVVWIIAGCFAWSGAGACHSQLHP